MNQIVTMQDALWRLSNCESEKLELLEENAKLREQLNEESTPMTDKELLELAAKAAGIEIESFASAVQAWIYIPNGKTDKDGERPIRLWSPLTDDGDALRLAVKLVMSVDVDEREESTYAFAGSLPLASVCEYWRNDPYVATRRAIVRAAAEIGAQMNDEQAAPHARGAPACDQVHHRAHGRARCWR